MLTWPHDRGDWAPRLERVEPVFVDIARAIARHERVLVVCRDAEHRAHIERRLRSGGADLNRVRLHVAPSNDAWARDHGPITVVCENELLLLDFGFNGWGGKYAHSLDNAITPELHAANAFGDTPRQVVDMVLEGGSIDVDGAGTLLTTARCLLAPTRNPDIAQDTLEGNLKELLGLKRILWLHHGHLAGDDTDSHIDTLARYCDVHTIAYVACDDPSDEHYDDLKAMEAELQSFRAADGTPYRLVPLPWPSAAFNTEGDRLPATYANFLIINGAVLVPTYNDRADNAALTAVKKCFPDRQIIGIDCSALIEQFGSLHCVTMQLPAGVL